MADPDRQGSSNYKRTQQEMQNSGFDEVFKVPVVEMLAYNVNTNTLDRAQIDNSGGFLSTPTAPTAILNGKTIVDTAGVHTQLSVSTVCKSVTIRALTTNTGIIYVGNGDVAASNGLELLAGDSVSFDINDLSIIYIDSSINGEGVTYLGVN